MKIENTGYTLIELIITVVLLMIVLMGGTAIFYRSFRSGGLSDVETQVNNGVRSLSESLGSSIRYGSILRVVDGGVEKSRQDCLVAGETGVAGEALVIRDIYGQDIIYELDEGVVSSNSGTVISSPDIFVTDLRFVWYCRGGVNDKLGLFIEASSSATIGDIYSGVIDKDINLLNSGIN